MIQVNDELRTALNAAPGQPVRLTDPESHEEFVVLPADLFDLLTSAVQDKTLTKSEQVRLLVAAGLRAGWDDPAMDVYNDLDPRRQ